MPPSPPVTSAQSQHRRVLDDGVAGGHRVDRLVDL
eukprot:CAMPEP_0203885636 /NCGR_PEP_ID=MMETSP0359-20131031/29540_1 /ASSEMBLY_ACC=CAM_ASM_000338 /TAXON_ID=268821 /ORGANISM="Scrippsiella Hangoei, Strain SHTV-5" /LENGTH=34 /DNA_ID= /DNA_START= /DNA_END= /DNA_ORIENTATION=